MRTIADTKQNRATGIEQQIPWRVTRVEALPSFQLHVQFEDGTKGVVDMAGFLKYASQQFSGCCCFPPFCELGKKPPIPANPDSKGEAARWRVILRIVERHILKRDCGVFKVLCSVKAFEAVHVEHGAVTWPEELDLAPDRMHDELQKAEVYIMRRALHTYKKPPSSEGFGPCPLPA